MPFPRFLFLQSFLLSHLFTLFRLLRFEAVLHKFQQFLTIFIQLFLLFPPTFPVVPLFPPPFHLFLLFLLFQPFPPFPLFQLFRLFLLFRPFLFCYLFQLFEQLFKLFQPLRPVQLFHLFRVKVNGVDRDHVFIHRLPGARINRKFDSL